MCGGERGGGVGWGGGRTLKKSKGIKRNSQPRAEMQMTLPLCLILQIEEPLSSVRRRNHTIYSRGSAWLLLGICEWGQLSLCGTAGSVGWEEGNRSQSKRTG